MSRIYSWNTFEDIHGGIVGARDCFEKACAELLRKENPNREVHRIEGAGGDGGIDVAVSYGKDGVDIYQCKYYKDSLTKRKFERIQESFDTLLKKHEELKIRNWFLCVPKTITQNEILDIEKFRSFNECRGISIRFIDGDELIDRMDNVGIARKWFSEDSDNDILKNKIPIFLSYPKPINRLQQRFIDILQIELEKRGIYPRNMGVGEYSMDAPMVAIRRIMSETRGCLCVAFRRTYIQNGESKSGADIEGQRPSKIADVWYTSAFSQIEPAMAFQQGIPLLIFREKGVIEEGILEKGNCALYMPEIELDNMLHPIDEYFRSKEFCDLLKEFTDRCQD